jgi:hypothetical protein
MKPSGGRLLLWDAECLLLARDGSAPMRGGGLDPLGQELLHAPEEAVGNAPPFEIG